MRAFVHEEIKQNDLPGSVTPPSANQNPRLYAEFDGIQ